MKARGSIGERLRSTLRRSIASSSTRVAIASALLLLLVGVAGALADVDGAEAPVSDVQVPTASEISTGITEIEAEQAAREEELESPALTKEREASRTAYTDASAAEAKDLLLSSFPAELEALNSDPARALADLKVEKVFDESVATVSSSDGESSLLEAGIPVRTEDEQGQLRKVDLELVANDDGFEAENPLAEVAVPEQAEDPISVGESGLAIEAVGADALAEPFGSEAVFYPDALPDTDLMVAPITAGVEVFDQLRSSESPEALSFHLQLPEGATLQPNGTGGAEIFQGGESIGLIMPPSAVDAQGSNVPVALQIDGAMITVQVPHRSGDYAYPILVDPAILENFNEWWWWNGISGSGGWEVGTNDPWQSYFVRQATCISSALCAPSGQGLYVSSRPGTLAANYYAQWVYNVPGSTTYIPSIYPEAGATIYPFFRNNESCGASKYPQPHDYDGIFNEFGQWTYLETERAQWYGSGPLFNKGKGIAFGLSMGTQPISIPCWRHIVAGGYWVRLDDPEAPTINSVTSLPTGWVGNSTAIKPTVKVTDPGLGVRNVTISPAGMPGIPYFAAGTECPGSKVSPCLATRELTFNLSAAQFDQGEKEVQISATDPTGKTSGTYSAQMKVDRTAPEITLSGQLATATKQEGSEEKAQSLGDDELSLPSYNLAIEAKDGSTATPASKRSGVKKIEVFLDKEGTPKQSWTQTCAAGSCAMTKTFALNVNALSAGPHVLKVVVKDQLEQAATREINFEYVPATGIKDEYLMQHFALPDGIEHEGEEVNHGPELAVNLMNGNLVYHERDVNVEGPNVDLELERFYNSQLPSAENTEWGDGWTLAQTPELEPIGGGTPKEAQLLDASGALDEGVQLPTEAGKEVFDPALQATIAKEAGGTFALTDASGEEDTIAFNPTGQTEELQTSGPASVEYDYKEGALSEIAVEDPTSSVEPPVPPEVPTYTGIPVYSSAFGSPGSGNGQFSHPADVAQIASGRLWVVDEVNNRLEQFNSAGEYITKVGTTGSGNGQFSRPTAIALGTTGNLFITDAGNKRVEVLNDKGEFVRAFGSAGTGNGQFAGSGPEGIAVSSKGNVWVSDTYGGRLQEFSETGTFIRAVGTKGSGSGQLGEPTGLATVGGQVFVADWQNNRVAVFTEAGEFVRQFGSVGAGNGQFSHPDAVEIDSRGGVWVLDQSNGRIQEFDQKGTYVGKFGTTGSGTGQFSFAYPNGLTINARGQLWIADATNNRVQKWTIPGYVPSYSPASDSSFGSAGTGNGQFNLPADVAVEASGNLLVADATNNRIQRFNEKGEFIAKFGSVGSGNGQLNRPAAIALDAKGNFWIADSNNNRIQEFNEKGEYVLKFGSSGSEPGKLSVPEGLAIGADENLYVADTHNQRIEVFTPKGEFLRSFAAPKPPGASSTFDVRGIDFGASETLFAADWANNRVVQFSPQGEVLGEFGTTGSGNGQLNHPFALDVDDSGVVRVSDTANNRVELFDETGNYVGQFGSKGSGTGQFSLEAPTGIATNAKGAAWITDPLNNRVQKWVTPTYEANEEALAMLEEPNDPAVEVEVTSGLVRNVEGEEAGESTYAYTGDDLVAHDGPEGETKYEYDGEGRMTKVTLPNGTVATIAYDSTYHRVSSVAVDPAGAEPAKTTTFSYSSEPRRTTVTAPSEPVVTYDLGADGALLKWSNAAKAPEFTDLAGSLYANRETEAAIPSGVQNLLVQASSPEGISSVQVVANGNLVVAEQRCEQNPETPGVDCTSLSSEWVVETSDLDPGLLQMEVLAEDRIGNTSSNRFWANVPYTPPPAPDAEEPPTFDETKYFRESYGLDPDLSGGSSQQELNDRVYDLLAAWRNPLTAPGVVARRATEQWGIPLRPSDVAELEYREWYMGIDGPAIDDWAEEHFGSSYSGQYVGQSGGIIYVGFTEAQGQRVAELKAALNLPANDRIQPFPIAPMYSLGGLKAAEFEVGDIWAQSPELRGMISEVMLDLASNRVSVGTNNVAATESAIKANLGSSVPVSVFYQPESPFPALDHFRTHGRIRAGDGIVNPTEACTAGFGAYEDRNRKGNGERIRAHFLLTAGHCYALDAQISRPPTPPYADSNPSTWIGIGHVTRRSYGSPEFGRAADAEAVWLQATGLTPYQIAGNSQPLSFGSPEFVRAGDTLCFSGARTRHVRCNKPIAEGLVVPPGTTFLVPLYEVAFKVKPGDSGGPVWNRDTKAAVGIVSLGRHAKHVGFVAPLIHLRGRTQAEAPGALRAPGMHSLHLVMERE